MRISFLFVAVLLGSVTAHGGQYDLDFVAANPACYDHTTGGGAYNDGTLGADIVESLEATDFACGETVSFLAKVDAEISAPHDETLVLTFRFRTSSSGLPGTGFPVIDNVAVNYGNVSNGAGTLGLDGSCTINPATYDLDAGMRDDGHSTVEFTTVMIGEAFVDTDAYLLLLVTLNPGESIVVRIDAVVRCEAAGSGNLEASYQNGYVSGVGGDLLFVAQKIIPFNGVGVLLGGRDYPAPLMLKRVARPDPMTGECPCDDPNERFNVLINLDSADDVGDVCYCYRLCNLSPVYTLYNIDSRVGNHHGFLSEGSCVDCVDGPSITGDPSYSCSGGFSDNLGIGDLRVHNMAYGIRNILEDGENLPPATCTDWLSYHASVDLTLPALNVGCVTNLAGFCAWYEPTECNTTWGLFGDDEGILDLCIANPGAEGCNPFCAFDAATACFAGICNRCGTVFIDALAEVGLNPFDILVDTPLGGIKVELLDEADVVLDTAITAGDGSFCFSATFDGNYTVRYSEASLNVALGVAFSVTSGLLETVTSLCEDSLDLGVQLDALLNIVDVYVCDASLVSFGGDTCDDSPNLLGVGLSLPSSTVYMCPEGCSEEECQCDCTLLGGGLSDGLFGCAPGSDSTCPGMDCGLTNVLGIANFFLPDGEYFAKVEESSLPGTFEPAYTSPCDQGTILSPSSVVSFASDVLDLSGGARANISLCGQAPSLSIEKFVCLGDCDCSDDSEDELLQVLLLDSSDTSARLTYCIRIENLLSVTVRGLTIVESLLDRLPSLLRVVWNTALNVVLSIVNGLTGLRGFEVQWIKLPVPNIGDDLGLVAASLTNKVELCSSIVCLEAEAVVRLAAPISGLLYEERTGDFSFGVGDAPLAFTTVHAYLVDDCTSSPVKVDVEGGNAILVDSANTGLDGIYAFPLLPLPEEGSDECYVMVVDDAYLRTTNFGYVVTEDPDTVIDSDGTCPIVSNYETPGCTAFDDAVAVQGTTGTGCCLADESTGDVSCFSEVCISDPALSCTCDLQSGPVTAGDLTVNFGVSIIAATGAPTVAPTASPTPGPTATPTGAPSVAPSAAPTVAPTVA
eukprot:CAMPEP_0170757398 /NCGR_PEP_ID=MMETSP0437-20130122/14510_1 /TAXON_ID=0 /ORGANISM="Sexangularia sp." /LENGTH=1079 /DNA_ID=CAMNT_0011096591 /DNA_START=41 /DNA_END=3277 /DNA_ORIENTATION=+